MAEQLKDTGDSAMVRFLRATEVDTRLLGMIGALGKMHEWEIHCRGAIRNGVTREEIRSIIHVVGIYCGVPQALECFRAANRVFEEQSGS